MQLLSPNLLAVRWGSSHSWEAAKPEDDGAIVLSRLKIEADEYFKTDLCTEEEDSDEYDPEHRLLLDSDLAEAMEMPLEEWSKLTSVRLCRIDKGDSGGRDFVLVVLPVDRTPCHRKNQASSLSYKASATEVHVYVIEFES